MGAFRRLSSLGVLMGLLVAVVPQGHGPAAADEPCAGPLAPWLECWASNVESGKPYVVTLNDELSLLKPEDQQRDVLEDDIEKRRHQLVVEVPRKGRTGDGGTALLVLAGGRLVHPDAKIDRIPRWAVDDLDEAGVCVPRQLCDQIVEGDSRTPPLEGSHLIELGLVADLSTHVDAVTPLPIGPPPASPEPTPSRNGGDKGDKGSEQEAGGNRAGTGAEASGDSGFWAALWMGLLLALLLLAFGIVIRRSRGPVAVGHRALPGRTAAAPARSPAHAARGGDENTTRLRTAPAPRHGRQASARPAHARSAVVRTELHPQGYVELDRVLYRAVWADPGRPPPAPGGYVDVAEARERDTDVLHAFPPAARHAKGTPR